MIEVAAGILADARGRVLLMQRLPGKHLAGLWEFPGGKLEPGETIEQALARELREELGIETRACAPLISSPWHYPEKLVRLHALRVTAWTGKPHAREGHPLRWVDVGEMDVAQMPPADAPIVAALRLPPYYAIGGSEWVKKTGSGTLFEPAWPHPFPGKSVPDPVFGPVFASDRMSPHPKPPPHEQHRREGDNRDGFRLRAVLPLPQADSSLGGEGRGEGAYPPSILWQLRMPNSDRDNVRDVALTMLATNPHVRESLLLNHDIDFARELGVGVHLRAAQLRELRERPLPGASWVGASCHDAEELELAARLGADFATLSPVQATASHPDAKPLGWDEFARLVADARLPVYALGGATPADLERARAAGAQGVAGIRAFV